MIEVEDYCPRDRADWRRWLELNHKTTEAVWLIFYKKGSPNYNLSWSESVDEAFCYGWIDSTKRTIDRDRYKQYFSKRRAKSNWSKVNKDKVKALIDQGLMRAAGYDSIEIAKENGSWTVLDAIEELLIPEDLKEELANHQGASHYFDSLSKSDTKILLYWVLSAKRSETRKKRVVEIATNASKKLKPKQFR